KTNQFNLTTRRHNAAALQGFVNDPECVHRYLKLRDRLADHGLVSLAIAKKSGETLDIDTWLMSCRVIGRTVEDAMLAELCDAALDLGCTALVGTYIPTAKNAMVSTVYERFGFEKVDDQDGTTTWRYDLARDGRIECPHIDVTAREMATDDAA
ncbi:MAG: hypothetical protein KC983_03975, partial [Phycisphaerales bacterium]|nr:hypothetical protein [Phycisphaerales bacterium]